MLSKENLPVNLIIGFNLITIFVFSTSPIEWYTDNLYLFYLLSGTCQFLTYVGYKRGFKNANRINLKGVPLALNDKRSVNFIFGFYILTFLLKYAYLLKFKPYEIIEMVKFLSIGIADPKLGYLLSLDSSRITVVPWFIYFLISIINQIFFIVGFFSWKSFSKIKKILFLFLLFIEIYFWMGRGTNFGVIVLITTLILVLLINLKIRKIKFSFILKYFFIIISLFSLSISFFGNNMAKRSGNQSLNLDAFDLGNSIVDPNHISLQVIPEKFHLTYMYVVSYMAQGYYHTCLAFDLEYQPTYFLANNPGIISFSDIFGLNFYTDTYVYRLKSKGVDPDINWHSSYTWYASDFTFLGVPFVFFYLGYFFGYCWNLGHYKGDFLSKILFVIIGNSLIFTFANNNYLSTVFYTLIILIPLWYFTRIKKIKI